MDGKFFTDGTKDLIVKVADEAIKLGFIGETIDGPIIRGTVNIIDGYADKYVPDTYDANINAAAQLALNGDYEAAAASAGAIIDGIVDIKSVDDTIEKLVFVDGMVFLVRIIQDYIEKKKAA